MLNSIHNLLTNIMLIAPQQVHLPSSHAWIEAFDLKQPYSLGYMVRLHLWYHGYCIHRRQCYPRIRRPCILDWCPFGNTHVFPADGLHVAI
jgi:hypothetical protein